MQPSGVQFGPLESRLMAWTQWRGIECATTPEIASALRLNLEQARQLMKRLGKKGIAIALRKGLWLLPRTLPPGGCWSPSPALVLRHLFKSLDGEYQETGPAVFQYHALTDQVANVTTVYNTHFSGRSKIGGLQLQWIKVAPARLGHLTTKALPERRIGSLARVVMDAIHDSARFGTLPAAFEWIRDRIALRGFVKELADCALEHSDPATCRRLGAVLDLLEAPKPARNRLRRALPPFDTHIALVPGRSRAGKILPDWGVIVNERRWLDA